MDCAPIKHAPRALNARLAYATLVIFSVKSVQRAISASESMVLLITATLTLEHATKQKAYANLVMILRTAKQQRAFHLLARMVYASNRHAT
jgi:hypothetical protein